MYIKLRNHREKPHLSSAVIPLLLLIVFTSAIYINAAGGKFVYDDMPIISENPWIKDLKNIPLLFRSNYWGRLGNHGLYRPVVMTSYAIDYKIWKLNPAGFHLMNIIIHILNVILVYFIAIDIFEDKKAAFIAALLFSVHPVHVEAVSGIVGRAELLSTFFIFLSWKLYIKEGQSQEFTFGIWYILSILFYFLALLSKENAAVFPFLLGIYFLCIKRRDKGRIFRDILPFLFITFIYFLVRFIILGRILISKEGQFFSGTNLIQRVPAIGEIITKYIVMLFFPFNLLPIYSHLFRTQAYTVYSMLSFLKIFFIVLIITYTLLHSISSNQKSIISFCILWFFISIFPVSNIIPIGTSIADRLLYLPSLGFCLFVPVLFYKLQDKFIIIPVGIAILFAVLSVKQNRIWRDNLSLWEYTVKKAPMSSTAHNNLGIELLDKRSYHKAITEFTIAATIDQKDFKSYLNLGVAYQKIGRYADSMDAYNRALEINPDSGTIYLNIGNFYFKEGKYDLAEHNYKKGIERNLESASLHNNLGVIYMNRGLNARAKEEFEKAIKLDPSHENAKKNLQRIL